MTAETLLLLESFLICALGGVSFVYGHIQGRAPHMVVGATLLGFPFFVSNPLVMGALSAPFFFCCGSP